MWPRFWLARLESLPRQTETTAVSSSQGGLMALIAVKRRGHRTRLVIEAAAIATVDTWLVFQCADGQPLATLPGEEVLGIETVTPLRDPARRSWS